METLESEWQFWRPWETSGPLDKDEPRYGFLGQMASILNFQSQPGAPTATYRGRQSPSLGFAYSWSFNPERNWRLGVLDRFQQNLIKAQILFSRIVRVCAPSICLYVASIILLHVQGCGGGLAGSKKMLKVMEVD